MENIKLQLTLDEVNNVLTLLGQQPYYQVFELVQKIQQQASVQVTNTSKVAEVAEVVN